jgi:hypothetical protein
MDFFLNESHLDYEFMQGARADLMLLYVKNDKHLYRKNVTTTFYEVYRCRLFMS